MYADSHMTSIRVVPTWRKAGGTRRKRRNLPKELMKVTTKMAMKVNTVITRYSFLWDICSHTSSIHFRQIYLGIFMHAVQFWSYACKLKPHAAIFVYK